MPVRKGKVGSSLASESAVSSMGKMAAVGAVGEKYFWKMVTGNSRTCNYDMWASLKIPVVTKQGRNGKTYRTKQYQADVDFAIANGDTIVLVDAKRYAAGKTYWSMGRNIMEGFGYKRDKSGKKILMSANMSNATDKYRARAEEIRQEMMRAGKKVKPVKIVSIVVFVPTAKRRFPKSVRWVRWPGGINSYLPEAGVSKIARLLGKPVIRDGDTYTNPVAVKLLNSLVNG